MKRFIEFILTVIIFGLLLLSLSYMMGLGCNANGY